MRDIYKKLYELMSRHERKRAGLVLLLLTVVALVDTLGVASIMPFIAVLANPDVVTTNEYLAAIYEFLGYESNAQFMFFLGVFFFAVLVASLLLRALGTWAQLRFSHNRNHHWSARLLEGYLRQPYEWFLNRNSADMSTAILAEVAQVVGGALFPAMQIIANVLVLVFLVAILFAVDPVLTLGIGIGVGGGFAVVQVIVRNRLNKIGQDRREANQARYKVVQEALGGVKEVKVLGLEDAFVVRFNRPSNIFAKTQIDAGLITALPPYAMQALLFGGMLLALLYLMATYDGFENAIPIVALFAFSGYRLLPALQKIYEDAAHLKYSEPALDSLRNDFEFIRQTADGKLGPPATAEPLRILNEISLENIWYSYPGAEKSALSGVTLRIPARKTVAIVGRSGSGKTTIVDLLLGLLRPAKGSISVDSLRINERETASWLRSIGYVPQQIFLTDDTVAANIAFGVPKNKVDMGAVESAARAANLHEFILEELPEQYATFVGERGVRLSGGQRQRIGIARALYHDPDVLVLDEATSALDNLTEQGVMDSVHALGNQKTIILIAHRLSTVQKCDSIFVLNNGFLAASGTYDELVLNSPHFRAIAAAS